MFSSIFINWLNVSITYVIWRTCQGTVGQEKQLLLIKSDFEKKRQNGNYNEKSELNYKIMYGKIDYWQTFMYSVYEKKTECLIDLCVVVEYNKILENEWPRRKIKTEHNKSD